MKNQGSLISQYGHESSSEKHGLLYHNLQGDQRDCEIHSVNCNVSLKTKGLTQPFIEIFHIEVLVS